MQHTTHTKPKHSYKVTRELSALRTNREAARQETAARTTLAERNRHARLETDTPEARENTIRNARLVRFTRSARHYSRVARLRARAIPETPETLADKIGKVVVHRINHPKTPAGKVTRKQSLEAKQRPMLSEADAADVRQTCALVLVASGALERGKLEIGDWLACFRATRAMLRIDTHHSKADATDVSTLDTISDCEAIASATSAHFSVSRMQTFRRSAIARKARYMRACISAAYQADTSRKARFTRDNALRFLRYVTSQYSLGMGQAEILTDSTPEAAYMKRLRFQKYLANGEAVLNAIAERDIAMRSRNRDAQGAIKTFQAIAI